MTIARTIVPIALAAALGCHKQPAAHPPIPAPFHIYPADSVRTDPNGFLLNPRWHGGAHDGLPDIEEDCRFRARTGHLERRDLFTTRPHCLSDAERELVSLNESSPPLGLGIVCVTGGKTGQVKGHVNWFPVTVTGQMVWKSFSSGVGDRDLNIDFITPDSSAAATTGNATFPTYRDVPGYHLESYYDETLRVFQGVQNSFWRTLKSVYKRGDEAHALIDDRFAIVTGVYGVDAVHGNHAELHPVLAMSVLVDTSTVGGALRERWAVMLRNQGGEGDCAAGTLPLQTVPLDSAFQDFFINLGAWGGRVPSMNMLQEQPIPVPAPTAVMAHDSIYLRIVHPQPVPGAQDFVFFGTFYVDWPSPDRGIWARRFDKFVLPGGPPIKSVALTVGDAPPALVTPLGKATHAPQANPPVLARKTQPWPQHAEAGSLDCRSVNKSDPLCFKASRWLIGYAAVEGWKFPELGNFRYPHSSYFEGEGFGKSVLNYVIYSLGDRWDFRVERHRPKPGTRDFGKGQPTTCLGHAYASSDARCGFAVRWNPYLSPNTVRFTENIVLMPYTAGSLGVSILDRPGEPLYHGVGFATGFGLGFHLDLWNNEVFVERQITTRSWYQDQWVTTVGLLLPFFRSDAH